MTNPSGASPSLDFPQDLPLRLLVATLMLDRDPRSELVTEEDIAELEGNGEPAFLRGTWSVTANAASFGLTVADVTVGTHSGDECDSYEVSLMFMRGGEVVIITVNCPGYCDDEADGSLTNLSDVMSRGEAQKVLAGNIEAFRKEVEDHLSHCARQHAKALSGE